MSVNCVICFVLEYEHPFASNNLVSLREFAEITGRALRQGGYTWVLWLESRLTIKALNCGERLSWHIIRYGVLCTGPSTISQCNKKIKRWIILTSISIMVWLSFVFSMFNNNLVLTNLVLSVQWPYQYCLAHTYLPEQLSQTRHSYLPYCRYVNQLNSS